MGAFAVKIEYSGLDASAAVSALDTMNGLTSAIDCHRRLCYFCL